MGTVDLPGSFGLGCVNLGASGRSGVRLVHHALDLGVRFFDTADAYGAGSSERVMGRALRGRRHRAYLATKAGYVFRERSALECAARRLARPALQQIDRLTRPGSARTSAVAGRRRYGTQDFSAKYLRAALEASLQRLDTDHVDLFQLHGPRRVCDDDVLALMLDLRSEGKIRGFGVGLETVDDAMDWLGTGALASIQIPFGVLDPEAGSKIIPCAMGHDIPVVARGVFAGGFLADRSDGDDALLRPGQPEIRSSVRALASATGLDALQIAAWFVTTNPGVTTVLVGTSSVGHLEQSLRYVEARPPEDVLPHLRALAPTDIGVCATDPPGHERGPV